MDDKHNIPSSPPAFPQSHDALPSLAPKQDEVDLNSAQISTHLLYPAPGLPISLLPAVDPECLSQKQKQLYISDGNVSALEIDGVHYNSRGYEICGQLNQHSKPCQRIGTCPFHKRVMSTSPVEIITKPPLKPDPPIKKKPYKRGWTKEEHLLFLSGLQVHGKGAWKEISMIVRTRTPTQIQSHAQKYFLRQKQEVKNKRSIHDISLDDFATSDMPEPSRMDHMHSKQPLAMHGRSYVPTYPLIAQSPYPPQDLNMFLANPLSTLGMSPSFPIPYWLPPMHSFSMPINLHTGITDERGMIELNDDHNDLSKDDGLEKRYEFSGFNYTLDEVKGSKNEFLFTEG